MTKITGSKRCLCLYCNKPLKKKAIWIKEENGYIHQKCGGRLHNTRSKQVSTDFAPSPQWLLDLFILFFDPCPPNPEFDGLKVPWKKRNYCNPPYSDKIPWIKKAIEEKEKRNITVMLLPHAPGAAWYHDLIIPNAEILSFRGRLQLDNGKHPRTDSMLVIFH